MAARRKKPQSKNQPKSEGVVQDNQRDEENKSRFVDQRGIAAQDLPGAERGQNVVDPSEEMTRNLPQQHGGERESKQNYGEGGLRGSRDLGEAANRGGRGKN
jgi:hypothetical protein